MATATRKRKEGVAAPTPLPAKKPRAKSAAGTAVGVATTESEAAAAAGPSYFLVKNEPDELSIQHIMAFPARTLPDGSHMAAQTMYWDGGLNSCLRARVLGCACVFIYYFL